MELIVRLLINTSQNTFGDKKKRKKKEKKLWTLFSYQFLVSNIVSALREFEEINSFVEGKEREREKKKKKDKNCVVRFFFSVFFSGEFGFGKNGEKKKEKGKSIEEVSLLASHFQPLLLQEET